MIRLFKEGILKCMKVLFLKLKLIMCYGLLYIFRLFNDMREIVLFFYDYLRYNIIEEVGCIWIFYEVDIVLYFLIWVVGLWM